METKIMSNRNPNSTETDLLGLKGLTAVFDSMSKMLGLLTLLVCLSISGYIVYQAAPALNAIPEDIAFSAAIQAMMAIDGMVFAPFIAGIGIAIWWKSRS